MADRLRGSLLVIASAVCFGLLPIFARFAYADGAKIFDLLFVRFVIAFLMLGAYLGLQRKIKLPPRKILLILLGMGSIGYFMSSTFYFSALLYIPVSVVVLILYTYPAFVTGMSFLFGFDKISVRLMLSLLFALTGLALVANPAFSMSPIGPLLALGASLAYTGFILVGSRFLKKLEGEESTFYILGATALSFGILGSFSGGLGISWNAEGWIWVILIALVSTTLSMTLFFKGLRLIGPSRTSILSTAELVTSVVMAFIVFNETLTTLQLVGGLLILMAAILAALSQKKEA
jgi:drug/metabolite transporter (DMT)-like permease